MIEEQSDPDSDGAPKKEGEDGPANQEKLIVDIWKQAVDTQKHFNDMCVKSRQLGLTFVAASLGAALYLFIRTSPAEGEAAAAGAAKSLYAYSVTVWGRPFVLHVSLIIVIAAAAAVLAVRRLDLGVYHQMLRGAVTFGEDLEEKHIRPLLQLRKGMTQTISHFSRHSDARVERGEDGRYEYFGIDRKNAGEKLKGFYNLLFAFLAVLAVLIFAASNFLRAVG